MLVAEPANSIRTNNQLKMKSCYKMKGKSEEDLSSHLNSFVKPAIAAIEPAASPGQHLLEHLLHASANNSICVVKLGKLNFFARSI